MATKYLTNMKSYIISLFLFIPVIIFGQNTHEINLTITDTVITVKEGTRRNRYAAKVNVEINVPNLHDTLFLYNFNKYVSAAFFHNEEPFDEYYKDPYFFRGLYFFLEDKNQNTLRNEMILISFARRKDERKSLNSRNFVTSKMQIKKKVLNYFEQRDYDLAKYEITNEKQSLILYPLLGRHPRLSQCEYLYFVYVFEPVFPYIGLPANIANDSHTFKGYFVSNKIKLIVK